MGKTCKQFHEDINLNAASFFLRNVNCSSQKYFAFCHKEPYELRSHDSHETSGFWKNLATFPLLSGHNRLSGLSCCCENTINQFMCLDSGASKLISAVNYKWRKLGFVQGVVVVPRFFSSSANICLINFHISGLDTSLIIKYPAEIVKFLLLF